jgi:hypothetical protein
LKKFLFISLITFTYSLKGQRSFYHFSYKEKTKEIKTSFSKDLGVNEIVIYKPMVEYRVFNDNKDVIYDIQDKGLNSNYIKCSDLYISADSLAKIISNLSNAKIGRKLSKYLKCKQGYFGRNDSLYVKNELVRIKEKLKDSAYSEYDIGEDLISVLKGVNSHHVLMTVTFYQIDLHYPRIRNNWALYTLYVIDARSKKLIFYNYKQIVAHTYETMFNYKSQKNFIGILKSYKKFLRENKKRRLKESES